MSIRKSKIAILSIIGVVIISGIVILKGPLLNSENVKTEVVAASTYKEITVETYNVKTKNVESVKTYNGTLEPKEVAIVGSKMSGRITDVLFENGDYVEKGTPLALQDAQGLKNQITIAKNQLVLTENQREIFEANLKKINQNQLIAQRTYDRAKERYEELKIPKEEFERAEDTLEIVNAEISAAILNYETLKINKKGIEINISNINDLIDDMSVKAPMSGIVDEKNVKLGQYITVQGSPTILAKINDVSTLKAVINVQQDDINSFKIGQKATIKLNSKSNETYEGTVSYVDMTANIGSRTFDCKIEIDNLEGKLKTGAFVKVLVKDEKSKKIITIPIKTLQGNKGSYFVLVAENGFAKRKNITIGETIEHNVEVASGLNVGEKVIATGLSGLQDGDKIKVLMK